MTCAACDSITNLYVPCTDYRSLVSYYRLEVECSNRGGLKRLQTNISSNVSVHHIVYNCLKINRLCFQASSFAIAADDPNGVPHFGCYHKIKVCAVHRSQISTILFRLLSLAQCLLNKWILEQRPD